MGPGASAGWSVDYFRCPSCGFLFSDFLDAWSPERLQREIYNDEYLRVDPEFAGERPERTAHLLDQLFAAHKTTIRILDYGGGTGALVRRLRDRGFVDVHSLDPFHGDAAPVVGRFDVIVCVEVFEHLAQPDAVLAAANDLMKDEAVLIFSTQVQPYDIMQCGTAWWYLAPRNGHVSLHTLGSLQLLARRHGLSFGSFNQNLHMAWRRLPAFAAHLAVYAQPGAPSVPGPPGDPSADDPATRDAEAARAEPILTLLRSVIPTGGVAIEANAGIGALALPLAHALGDRATVVAYEPALDAFRKLAAAVARSGAPNVAIRRAALGDRWGSTWLPPAGEAPAGIRPVQGDDTPARVRVETIDGLDLTHLDLIRLDADGLEALALDGALGTVRRLRPALHIANRRRERSPDLIRTVQDLGYQLWWHIASADRPVAPSAHLFCLPSERAVTGIDLPAVSGPQAWWT